MGLFSWMSGGSKAAQERQFVDAPEIATPWSRVHGPGLSPQPSHDDLLRANVGVADIATRAIANRISGLKLEVFVEEPVSDGTTKETLLDDHPLARLLDKPHPTFTTRQMLRLLGQYIPTVGEGYWLKTRSRLGMPMRLTPLPPQKVIPLPRGDIIEAYQFTDGNGALVEYPADAIIRFWWPDPEAIFESEGYLGPNAHATNALAFQEQTIEHHYENNAIPPAVIQARESTAVMPEDNALKRWLLLWQRRYNQRKGSGSGTPAWIPPGWEIIFSAIQSGKDIAPLLDHFQTQQLMNFGVPRSVLGVVVSGDRSSAETNQFVMDLHTIEPITSMIADALTQQLAPEFDGMIGVRFAEFIMRDRAEERADQAHRIMNKLASPNMLLEEEGMDKVPWGEFPPGTGADQPYTGEEREIPEQLQPFAGQSTSGSDAPSVDDEMEEGRSLIRRRTTAFYAKSVLYEEIFDPAMRQALRAVFRRQERVTLKRFADFTPRTRVSAGDLFNPSEWVALFDSTLRPVMERILRRVGGDTKNAITPGEDFVFTDAMLQEMKAGRSRLAERVDGFTLERIEEAIASGIEHGEGTNQIAKRLRGVFAELGTTRSKRIARTEVLRVSQAAQIESFRQTGVVTRKQWNTSLDSHVRDEHAALEAVIVDLNESFNVGGYPAQAPGDFSLPAAMSVNCRCFVTPVLSGESSEEVVG